MKNQKREPLLFVRSRACTGSGMVQVVKLAYSLSKKNFIFDFVEILGEETKRNFDSISYFFPEYMTPPTNREFKPDADFH